MDVTTLLLERVNKHFERDQTKGIFITDKLDGGNRNEKDFLEQCLETLLHGTNYVNFNCIIQNVFTTHSHYSRLLQIADVITSCTLARVAGEEVYSPQVFELIIDLFDSDNYGKIGGWGVKIHPRKYECLYGELLGDYASDPFLADFDE